MTIKKIYYFIIGVISLAIAKAIWDWRKTGKIGKAAASVLSLVFLILGLSSFYISAPESLTRAADTGLKSPTATGESYNNWTDPTYAYSSDDNWTYMPSSGTFDGQDYYDFTLGVPAGATITGIEVKIEGWDNNNQAGTDVKLLLGYSGSGSWGGGYYVQKDITWVLSEGIMTLGGSTDLWGRGWSVSDFSNANFRLLIVDFAGTAAFLIVDHIQVKVYYTEAAAERRIIKIE